jgi:hypothetical protein
MDLFNSYLDKQIALNSMANQFAQSGMNSQAFMGNNQETLFKGGGMPRGGAIPKNTSTGLDDTFFKKRKKAVQQELKSAGDEKAKEEVKADGDGDDDDDEDIAMSGNVGGGGAPEGKHDAPEDSVESAPAVSGFGKLIEGYGEPFKNSRSRKSIVFVPNEKALPLRGWKSLRNAGLSSKKLGKIHKNGDSFYHKAKDGTEGDLFFLNNQAWNGLRRKKKVVLEDE